MKINKSLTAQWLVSDSKCKNCSRLCESSHFCATPALQTSQMDLNVLYSLPGSKTAAKKGKMLTHPLIRGWPVMNQWFMVLQANLRTYTMMHTIREHSPRRASSNITWCPQKGAGICTALALFLSDLENLHVTVVHSASINVRWESCDRTKRTGCTEFTCLILLLPLHHIYSTPPPCNYNLNISFQWTQKVEPKVLKLMHFVPLDENISYKVAINDARTDSNFSFSPYIK